MPEDLSLICGIIAHDLARTHVPYYNNDTKRTKGMYRQRIQMAWGHTSLAGWRGKMNKAVERTCFPGSALVVIFCAVCDYPN